MKRPKYQFEIEVNEEASGYEDCLPWVSYGTIVAEGDTLEQLLDSASVDLVDQDGGNPSCSPVEADEAWMQELITEEFWKQQGEERGERETFGDFMARMENTHGA